MSRGWLTWLGNIMTLAQQKLQTTSKSTTSTTKKNYESCVKCTERKKK